MKLTDREWKAFHIGELFDYKRDQRQVAKNRLFGDVPYYSASDSNNGLTDMISNPSFVETDSSIICSTFGDAFFVHGRFTASDEMTILRNKYLNEYNVVPQIKRNSILHIIRDCFCDVSMNNSRLFDADSALYFI